MNFKYTYLVISIVCAFLAGIYGHKGCGMLGLIAGSVLFGIAFLRRSDE
jgi:hypothetical protein